MMRRWTTILAAVAIAAPVAGSAADLREESARDWDARGLVRVEVDNPRGDISVRPSRDSGVHLVALKVVKNSDGRGADELSRQTLVEAATKDGVLSIQVRYPQRRQIRIGVWDLVRGGIEIPEAEVRLSLEVPVAMRLALHTASGDLQTTGLSGRQDLVASSGDIEVASATGPVVVDTRSGDATLGDVATASIGTASGDVMITSAKGPIAVSTESGDVRIDSAADSVSVATASGEVRVGLARAGLDARTASGDIVARAGGTVWIKTASGEARVALVAPLRRAEVATGSGEVSLRVGDGVAGQLDASSGSGDIDVDLPLEVRSTHGNRVTGQIGRGSATIVLRSASGSVNVAR